jgi:hypothetical protein
VRFELLEVDPVSGKKTGIAAMVRRALGALEEADVPYAVVGAAALAARGLPRMTKDLDVLVVTDDAFAALDGLEAAGFRSVAPVRRGEDPEPMYVLATRSGGEVDLLVGAGEPESTIVAEPSRARLFGAMANVATLEQLLLMYLYSNQPKHLGDFHRIVVETRVDLAAVERYLADTHAEMMPTLRERVHAARNPPPAPPRPKRRPR